MVTQVNATAYAGSGWSETYTLTNPDNTPINLTGLTFVLSIRPDVTNTATPALVSVTSAGATAQGSVTITPLTGTVAVTLTPAATTLLADDTWPYALWSSPGTSAALAWVAGKFTSSLVAGP